MRSIWNTILAVSLVASGGDAANTRFCTQDEKELVNKRHEQNADPAKSCYRAANGDITTLVTSRLCPLPECVTWLAYMASNAPDCYFDSTNYAVAYAAKSADCTGDTSTSASATESLRSSSTGSDTSANTSTAGSNNSSGDGSFSALDEDRAFNTSDSMVGSIDGSAVGSVASVGGSDSTASASGNVDADLTTAPTPTPTEDLTIEDTTAPSSGSFSSTTPAPTSSNASRLPTISSIAALFIVAVTAFIEL